MTEMGTSAGIQQLGHLNPYVKPQGTDQALPHDPAVNYEDGYTPGSEGTEEAPASAPSHSGVMQIILAAKGKVVGLRVGMTSNPVEPEQAEQILAEVEAQIDQAEVAYASMSPDNPDYDNATQELIELHSSALEIVGLSAGLLSSDNAPEVNAAIANSAARLILRSNDFKQKINTSYINSSTASQVQNLDLETANAAYQLVNICLTLGIDIDPELAQLAEMAPAGSQNISDNAENPAQAAWLNDFQADLLNSAFERLQEVNQKIRDAFRQESQEEKVLEQKKAEERAEEIRIMKQKFEDKIEEIMQSISSIMNNPSLDMETAKKQLGALLGEVEHVISQLSQISVEMPELNVQVIENQLTAVKTQLEQLLDSLIGEPVGISQLNEQIGNAAQQLATAMNDLGMAVDPAVAEIARA